MTTSRERPRLPIWLGFCLFLAIAVFFLWEEHRAHILGVIPYAFLLACFLVHVVMHDRHGREHAGDHRHVHDGPGGTS